MGGDHDHVPHGIVADGFSEYTFRAMSWPAGQLGRSLFWLYLRYRVGFEAWMERYPPLSQAGWMLLAAVVALGGVQLVSNDQNLMGVGAAGFIVGAGAGAAAGLPSLAFTGRGPVWQRLGRLITGIPVMLFLLGLMQGLGLPDGGLGPFALAAYLALLGGWLTLGAPWFFYETAPLACRGSVRESLSLRDDLGKSLPGMVGSRRPAAAHPLPESRLPAAAHPLPESRLHSTALPLAV